MPGDETTADDVFAFALPLPLQPYPGLRAFDAAEWPIFFGRERMVDAVVSQLVSQHLTVVHGDSGSGKSSLIRAGVLPRLRQEQARGGLRWRTVSAMPRGGPLRNVALALAAMDGRGEDAERVLALRRALNQGRRAPAALAELLLCSADNCVLILIDQFEELFEHARLHGAGEARLLTDALVAIAEAPPAGLYVAVTMRSEYLGACARFPGLAEAVNAHQYLLPPMTVPDLLRAIHEPALLYGGKIDLALAERLASDAGGIDGLPMVQHALMLMQREHAPLAGDPSAQVPWRLSLAHYPEGGLAAQLSRHADVVAQRAQSVAPAHERGVENLFRALSAINAEGHAVRRPQLLSALAQTLLVEASALVPLIDVFRAEGVTLLLPREGRPLVQDDWIDISHEALIRSWQALADPQRGWLASEFRDGLVWRALLVQADSFERDPDNVLSPLTTEERVNWLNRHNPAWAERYGGGWDRVQALVAASLDRQREIALLREREQAARQAEVESKRREEAQALARAAELKLERRRSRAWLIGIGAVTLVVVFVAWANGQQSRKQDLAMKASIQTQRDPQLSLRLALEAVRHTVIGLFGDSTGAEQALRGALRSDDIQAEVAGYSPAAPTASALSPDGKVLVTGDAAGSVTFWDVDSGGQGLKSTSMLASQFEHVGPVLALAYSASGRWLASGGGDGRVIIWDLTNGKLAQVLAAHAGDVSSVAFSRDDRRLASAGAADGLIQVWNTATGDRLSTLQGHMGGVKVLVFGRDDDQLVSAGYDNRVVHWQARTGKQRYSQAFDSVNDIDLTEDGARMAVSGDGVSVWDLDTRVRIAEIRGHNAEVFQARFSADRQRLSTVGYDGTLRIWRLARESDAPGQLPQEMGRYLAPAQAWLVNKLSIDRQGDVMAAVGHYQDRNEVTVWRRAKGGERDAWIADQAAGIRGLAFEPGSLAVFSTSDLGSLSHRRLSADTSPERITGWKQEATAGAVVAGPGGALAMAQDNDVLVWSASSKAPLRLSGHNKLVTHLRFSSNGSRLLTGSHLDGTAIAWTLPAGERSCEGALADERDRTVPWQSIAYAADNSLVATGDAQGNIRLHACREGRWVLVRDIGTDGSKHRGGVNDLAFTDDARTLFSAGADKTIGTWHVGDGKLAQFLFGHQSAVQALALRDGVLASAAADGVRLWRLAGLALLPAFSTGTTGAQSLAFSADGKLLGAGSADGTVRVYALDPKDLPALAEARTRRGWSQEECREYGLKRWWSGSCPRSRFDLLAAAKQAMSEMEFDKGLGMLRELAGKQGDAEAVESEASARIESSLLWWLAARAEVIEGKTTETDPRTADWAQLATEAQKWGGAIRMEPEARLRAVKAYNTIRSVTQLAADGDVAAVATAYGRAQSLGWKLDRPPPALAARLVAVEASRKAYVATAETSAEERELLTQQLRAGIAADPDFGQAHWALGRLAVLDKDVAAAEKHLPQAAENLRSIEPLADLAQLQMELRRIPAAVRWAEVALKNDPSSDLANLVIGQVRAEQQKWDAAVMAFDRVSPYHELYALATNTAAAILFEHKRDLQASKARFERALALRPDDISILSNYAEFMLATRQLETAGKLARRVLRHPGIDVPEMANIRPAMAFVMLAANLPESLQSGRVAPATTALDAIERWINAQSGGKDQDQWSFQGIRRELGKGLVTDGPAAQRALMAVLDYVESNGSKGSVTEMRALLASRSKE